MKTLIIVKEEVNPEDLIKKDYETDEEFSLRVLGLLKYKFKDLELSKDNATRASYLIQKNLYNGLEEMVNLQPFSQRAVLSLGLKPVVNLLGYYPPSSYSYLEIGTYFEIGYSTDFYDFDRVVSPVKLNFSLATQGHESLFAGQEDVSAFTPSIGFEFNLYPISTVKYQFTLGIKGGYMFARKDKFGAGSCNEEDNDVQFTSC